MRKTIYFFLTIILVSCSSKISPEDQLNLNRRLLEATKNGDMQMVQALIKTGADFKNAVDEKEGRSALHWASFHGREEIVKFFLKEGCDPNKLDGGEWTPLHLTAFSGSKSISEMNRKNIAKLLIDAGADVNKKDGLNKTTLEWANDRAHKPLSDYLIAEGAQ